MHDSISIAEAPPPALHHGALSRNQNRAEGQVAGEGSLMSQSPCRLAFPRELPPYGRMSQTEPGHAFPSLCLGPHGPGSPWSCYQETRHPPRRHHEMLLVLQSLCSLSLGHTRSPTVPSQGLLLLQGPRECHLSLGPLPPALWGWRPCSGCGPPPHPVRPSAAWRAQTQGNGTHVTQPGVCRALGTHWLTSVS